MLALSLALVWLAGQEGATDDPCRIHGRLVDAQGSPVAGATLTTGGWTANSQRAQRFGVPANWTNPEPVVSSEDGRFEVSFVPPRAFQFTLKVEHEGYGKVGWRWGGIEPGSELDLGETLLEAPAVLTGHIVDSSGELLVEGWRIAAWHSWNAAGARSSQGVHTQIDPASGTFRIDDLPPGRIRVSASSDAGIHLTESVETKAGETTEIQLVYEGPDPSTRLVVSISSPRPFYTFDPEPGTVHAVAPNGVRRRLDPAPGRASDWHALDVAPGSYTIEVLDPRFEPLRVEGIETGTLQRVQLVGNAAIRLEVRADGEPVDAYGLRVKYRNVNFSPDTFTVAKDGSPAPLRGLFERIVPGDIEIEVRADGFPPQFARVDALQPNETREVSIGFERGRALEGRVLRADGTPVSGVRVQLTRGEYPGHDNPSSGMHSTTFTVDGERIRVKVGYRDAESTTDATGRFAFSELTTGTYALRALASEWVAVDAVCELVAGESEEAVLTLPHFGALDVSVQLPAGADAGRVRLVRGLGVGENYRPWIGLGPPGVPLSQAGAGSLEGLRAGEHELHLAVKYFDDGESRSWTHVPLGTVRVEAGERLGYEFDVRTSLPSDGPIRILVAGVRPETATVQLEEEDGQVRPGRGWHATPEGSWHHAPPGRYLMHVTHADAGWVWTSPELLEVRPGVGFDVTLDVPVVEREVRVVNADATPARDADITWWNEPLAERTRAPRTFPSWKIDDVRGKTDALGRLGTLSLPPGSFRFARAGATAYDVEITWEESDEPLVLVLRDTE